MMQLTREMHNIICLGSNKVNYFLEHDDMIKTLQNF